MPVHRRVTPSIKFAGTHSYTWVERGTVGVKCLAQKHNTISPAWSRTRTARSGVERTHDYEATAPTLIITLVIKAKLFENHGSSKWINLESCLVWTKTKNILKTKLFEDDGTTIMMWFPWRRVFLEHKSKMASNCCVLKFLRRCEEGNLFQPEPNMDWT